MKDGISLRIGVDLSDDIAGLQQAALTNLHMRQIALDRDIVAMTHQYVGQSIVLENGRNLSVEDTASHGPALAFDVHPLVVQPYMTQSLYLVLAIMPHDDIWAGHRYGQAALVVLEDSR